MAKKWKDFVDGVETGVPLPIGNFVGEQYAERLQSFLGAFRKASDFDTIIAPDYMRTRANGEFAIQIRIKDAIADAVFRKAKEVPLPP
jgi:hypothetical protein